MVDQAESFQQAGKLEAAKAKYETAQKALLEIKKTDPTWKATMVTHRLTDVAGKLAALSTPSTDEAAATTSASSKAAVSNESAAPVLKLLDAGAEPRRTVRLQPKAGDRQKFELTMNMSVEMSMAGTEMPAMNIPAIKLPLEVKVESVSAEGDISYTTTIGEATIESDSKAAPGVGEAMQSMFGSMKGLTSTGVISSRGLVKTTDMKVPAEVTPQLRQSLEQMKNSLSGLSAPFPEEPIGLGAKWELKQVLKAQEMTIKQTSAFELLALAGDRAEIKLTILQSAANQKITSPMMPGLKMDLEKMEGAGMGKTVYDLTRLMPVSGDVASGADIKMGMNMGGQKQAMQMKSTTKTRLESK